MQAFGSCERLTRVTIPSSVTSLEEGAFKDCIGLTHVEIPNSVTSIADGAFENCSHLTNITIPNSVIFLGSGAFQSCTSVKEVTIPDGVPGIADFTFFDCPALTNLTISASVTNIGASVFNGDVSLISINVSPLNPAYRSVNGVLFDKSETTLIQYPMGNPAQSYVIPNGVSIVGNFAFSDENNSLLANLASLTIPASVTNIGQNAFLDNFWLQALYFMGDNPAGGWVSYGASYHLPGTTGFVHSAGFWTTPNPLILQTLPNFGVQSNGFGFTISWASDATVVVAASTNLAAADWQPLQTNTLAAANGVWLFSDPEWSNYPARFYRVVSQ